MSEEKTETQVVENEKVKNDTSSNTKCAKKISGDLRTFVIALLTAVIVVLAYHGIILGIRCLKSDCGTRPENAPQCQMPPRPECPPPAPRCHHHHCSSHAGVQGETPQHRRGDGQHRRRDGQHHRHHQRPARPAGETSESPAPTPQESAE
ncbi:MAG: hypothetical protein E7053_06505 [Lentisphaerae bacterium]|nr:hypothetical protein [Lentisphaerota bacterium]